MKIRIASPNDWHVIIDIYNQAVDEKFCTADIEHVSIESRKEWLEQHSANSYPIIVCEIEGVVRGWCSLSPYRPGRKALSKVAEISYYVHKNYRRKGIGNFLVQQAINRARILGFRNLLAILLEPNQASISLLRKYGFRMWGVLPGVAEFDSVEYSQSIFGLKI